LAPHPTDGDQFSARRLPHQFIDQSWRRDQHRAAAKSLLHPRGNVHYFRLLRPVQLFTPGSAGTKSRIHARISIVGLVAHHSTGT